MLFSPWLMLRRVSIYIWVVAVFVSSEALAHYLGVRFASETLGTLYQYLDPTVLREDLARGLYYLHAQPPLFNFFLGVVVKIFPESYATVFSVLYGAMALAMLLGMAWLMRRFQIPDGVSGAVCLLFAPGGVPARVCAALVTSPGFVHPSASDVAYLSDRLQPLVVGLHAPGGVPARVVRRGAYGVFGKELSRRPRHVLGPRPHDHDGPDPVKRAFHPAMAARHRFGYAAARRRVVHASKELATFERATRARSC